MSGVTYLTPLVGIATACVMLAVARASYYRSLTALVVTSRPSPPWTRSRCTKDVLPRCRITAHSLVRDRDVSASRASVPAEA